MPLFTIETTYRLPVYRHHTYEAASIDEACRVAIDYDDWSDEKRDYESAGETYVTGIWSGANAAYSGAAQPMPCHYAEIPPRIALHFEVLLGLIKVLTDQGGIEKRDRAFWQARAASDRLSGSASCWRARPGLSELVQAVRRRIDHACRICRPRCIAHGDHRIGR